MRRTGLSVVLASLCLAGCRAAPAPASRPSPRPEAGPLVVLLTDYGTRDHYVATLKAVLYSRCPSVRIDSITHEIEPFNIAQGAEVLRQAAPAFPAGTVFVAVVDPGVGTRRQALVCRTRGGHVFVGPDNGLLWPALQADGIEAAWAIANPAILPAGALSSTFHGRDLFAPAAAFVAGGGDPARVGPPLDPDRLVKLDRPAATGSRTEVIGLVLEVDRYGNVRTNIAAGLLEGLGVRLSDRLRLEVGETAWEAPFVRTYADVPAGQPLALIDSDRRLELAINLGNLAARYGLRPGQRVRVTRAP